MTLVMFSLAEDFIINFHNLYEFIAFFSFWYQSSFRNQNVLLNCHELRHFQIVILSVLFSEGKLLKIYTGSPQVLCLEQPFLYNSLAVRL